MKKSRLKIFKAHQFLLAFLVSFFILQGQVYANSVKDTLHMGTGMISSELGSSVGASGGAFTLRECFNLEYERFNTHRTSLVFRGILALEMATTVTRYLFGGVGQRYYLSGRGTSLESTSSGVSLIIRPQFRYYLGWDLGVSQSTLNVLTASLQSITTALDGGGLGGAVYQINENIGIEISYTLSYVFGFSSVPATGRVTKLFIGGAYFF